MPCCAEYEPVWQGCCCLSITEKKLPGLLDATAANPFSSKYPFWTGASSSLLRLMLNSTVSGDVDVAFPVIPSVIPENGLGAWLVATNKTLSANDCGGNYTCMTTYRFE
eukprot:TRINITY_DN6071_c1_g1_i1.p1 TRINITY_DN6071_c1_g1~~TRINITY_DN6071_c1_g1_i1.p1  ORF type:complete len:109 (+),score=14.95 TRINITY_DN6071_c1_g1_i1:3-329(+)